MTSSYIERTAGNLDDARVPESAVVADVAIAAAQPVPLFEGRAWSVIVPRGATQQTIEIDPEKFADVPLRKRGKVTLFTAAAFSKYVNDHTTPGTAIYGDSATLQVVSVLDGHVPNEDGVDAIAGWAEHVATLKLRATPEWQHWLCLDGKRVKQEQFAEHIEDGLGDIVVPAAADMLEIAQSLHMTRQASFRSATRLADGRRQFLYSEDQTATAGERGDLEIPETFTLRLSPFEGSEMYEIDARLRYRLDDGHLTIGYKLDRPDVVIRTAFNDVLDAIETQTNLTPFSGTPPTK